MKKITVCLIIILSLVLTACPSKVTLEKAKQSSARIAGYANETTNAVRDLFRANVLTAEQTSKIADKIIFLAKNGQAFDALIKSLETTYQKTENVPKSEWSKALIFFNTEIVAAFIAVFVELKVIKMGAKLQSMIDLLINTIKIIARAFDVEQQVSAQIKEV